MKFRLKCENPEKIDFTLTATMTAEEWESVRTALDKVHKEYPAHQLVGAINDMLAQARKIYWPHVLPENTPNGGA